MRPSGCRCKCLHCKELFLPEPRAAQRQRYCLKAECRKARKRAAQRAWLAKPENQNYFRDAKNAERVRDWQKAHPGYWKNTARYRRRTLQDGFPTQPTAGQPITAPPTAVPPPPPAPPRLPTAIAVTRAPSSPEPLLPGAAAASTVTGAVPSRRFAKPYLTRPLLEPSAPVGGADLHVHRQYLTRRHRHQPPPADNQGTRHSGHGARNERGKVIA